MLLVDSRDVFHCPVLFSRSTDFSSPLQKLANFVVRVYVSIVAGGSVTTSILPRTNTKPSLKDGVSTQISDEPKRLPCSAPARLPQSS